MLRALCRTLLLFCAVTNPLLAEEYLEMSLEELMEVQITSVSKKPQTIGESSAAVFVISSEDIRRSSANSIVELLRMVPGLQVAAIDKNHWSVSSRGFDGQFSNKLLVLMDGRTLYSPLFSGTFWDDQDTMLEDIERIEVVRGPGGTIWGANAVNGVINIITRNAQDSVGTVIVGGAGDEKIGFVRVRRGVQLSDETAARVYAKYDRKDEAKELLSGEEGVDSEEDGRVGFRVDHAPTDKTQVTLQGDLYNNDGGVALQTLDPSSPTFTHRLQGERDSQGGNFISRLQHKFSKDSDVDFQLYYDRVEREELVADFTVDTIDAEIRHRYLLDDGIELQWGGGFRHIQDDIVSVSGVSYEPQKRSYDLYTGFVQFETELLDDELTFTFGSKVESNEFSGSEVQPSASLLWSPSREHCLWGSVARAVRTPSRGDQDVSFVPGVVELPGGQLGVLQFKGEPIPSENVLAYELGYRFKPINEIYIDLAAYYNRYDELNEFSQAGAPIVSGVPGEPVIIPITSFPIGETDTYGGELLISSKPLDWLNLQIGYSWIQIDKKSGSDVGGIESLETAENKATFRSMLDLSDEVELDLFYRYVDRIRGSDVPAYSELDARLGWRPAEKVEFSFIANNLFDSGHQEASADLLNLIVHEVEREFWGKVTVTF